MLERIDYFKEYQVDTRTKTKLGGFLTILIPFCLAAYISWQVTIYLATPPVPDVQLLSNAKDDQIFVVKLRCDAQDGCFYTQNYASDQKCADLLKRQPIDYSGKCTYLTKSEELTIPFCYVADPIDGPSFVWKRNNTYSGVSLYVETLGSDKANSWVSLFYGVQILSFTKIALPSGKNITQASPVQSSSETLIDSTNLCCPPIGVNSKGYVNGVPAVDLSCSTDSISNSTGNANDHYTLVGGEIQTQKGLFYQLKLRTFPTHTSITFSQPSLLSLLLSGIGGFMQVLLTVFTVVVFLYRKAFRRFPNVAPEKQIA